MGKLAWTIAAASITAAICGWPAAAQMIEKFEFQKPTVKPTGVWAGRGGLAITYSPCAIAPGVYSEGDILGAFNFSARRAGQVAEDVLIAQSAEKVLRVPLGTPVYAADYQIRDRGEFGRPKIDPVEWCGLTPNGFSGTDDSARAFCIFWQDPETAIWIEQKANPALLPNFKSSFGYRAGVPPIELTRTYPVDPEIKLRARLLLSLEKSVKLAFDLVKGEGRRRLFDLRVRYREDGKGERDIGGTLYSFATVGDAEVKNIAINISDDNDEECPVS